MGQRIDEQSVDVLDSKPHLHLYLNFVGYQIGVSDRHGLVWIASGRRGMEWGLVVGLNCRREGSRDDGGGCRKVRSSRETDLERERKGEMLVGEVEKL